MSQNTDQTRLFATTTNLRNALIVLSLFGEKFEQMGVFKAESTSVIVPERASREALYEVWRDHYDTWCQLMLPARLCQPYALAVTARALLDQAEDRNALFTVDIRWRTSHGQHSTGADLSDRLRYVELLAERLSLVPENMYEWMEGPTFGYLQVWAHMFPKPKELFEAISALKEVSYQQGPMSTDDICHAGAVTIRNHFFFETVFSAYKAGGISETLFTYLMARQPAYYHSEDMNDRDCVETALAGWPNPKFTRFIQVDREEAASKKIYPQKLVEFATGIFGEQFYAENATHIQNTVISALCAKDRPGSYQARGLIPAAREAITRLGANGLISSGGSMYMFMGAHYSDIHGTYLNPDKMRMFGAIPMPVKVTNHHYILQKAYQAVEALIASIEREYALEHPTCAVVPADGVNVDNSSN